MAQHQHAARKQKLNVPSQTAEMVYRMRTTRCEERHANSEASTKLTESSVSPIWRPEIRVEEGAPKKKVQVRYRNQWAKNNTI